MTDLQITPLWMVVSHRLFPKTKDYFQKDAIRDYFQVIEKGIGDKKTKMMQEMMEKLHALNGGRVLDI